MTWRASWTVVERGEAERVNKAISELYTTFLVHLNTKKHANLEIYLDTDSCTWYTSNQFVFFQVTLLWLIKRRTDFSSPEPSTDPPAGPGENPPAALKNSSWRRTGDWRSFQQKPNEKRMMNQWRPRKDQTENLTFNFLRKRNKKTKRAACGRIHGTWKCIFTYIDHKR